MPPSTTRTPATTAVRLLTATALTLGLGVAAVPLPATTAQAAVATPSSITGVTSRPGPAPGEATISWAHDGRNTTGYVIETGLTSFSYSSSSSLPRHARGSTLFEVPGGRRSVTLTAAQTAAAGAPVGSANHLYFRLRAVNRTSGGESVRHYDSLQTVGVAPAVPATTGTRLRVGTFNVRTARATGDRRSWLQRAPDVARSIIGQELGVVALQELGPGRADGVAGSTGGRPRQTDSLLTTLKGLGGSRYKLIRTTPYVKAGTATSTQGMRILYDSSRYRLVSDCVDTSPDGRYSASCSIALPIRPTGDTASARRKATYAEFAVRSTGERFYFVSVHLDARHASSVTEERTFDALRAAQVKAAIAGVAKVNTRQLPVILGGDLNTWQNNKVGYTAHDALVDAGFYDTAAAARHQNLRFTTMNDYRTTLPDPGTGFGSRLDAVLVQGVTGAEYWENVMDQPDPDRPSDHNLVLADIRLPGVGSTSPPPEWLDYQPVAPARLVDTRDGTGAARRPLAAGQTLEVAVTGRGGVPAAGVAAVALNLTAVGPRASGSLIAHPTGGRRPSGSTLPFRKGTTVANSIVVGVGDGGRISLHGSAATDVTVDVQGWFPDGSDFTALPSTRVLDTRKRLGTTGGKPAARTTVDLTVTGRGGVPRTGVAAVVLNLLTVDAASSGYLAAYPGGSTRGGSSTLGLVPGRTVANGVVAKVGTGGKVRLYVSAGTHVVADVQGWFPAGSDVTALSPTRVLDTRSGLGGTEGTVAAGQRVDLAVPGRAGVPASGVTAVVLNVTATGSSAGGSVTATTAGATPSAVTTLALEPGRTVANRVIVPVGAAGTVTLTSTARTHLVADVIAYVQG